MIRRRTITAKVALACSLAFSFVTTPTAIIVGTSAILVTQTACPKGKSPSAYAPYARIAVGSLKDVVGIFKANGADTAKIDIGIKVGERLVKAFESNSTDVLTIAAEFITAFEDVASDVDVIADPATRTKILVGLAVGNVALRTIAELVKADAPAEVIAAAESDAPKRGVKRGAAVKNATPLEIVVEFAKKPAWRCRSKITGRFEKMEVCRANPEQTTVERVK